MWPRILPALLCPAEAGERRTILDFSDREWGTIARLEDLSL